MKKIPVPASGKIRIFDFILIFLTILAVSVAIWFFSSNTFFHSNEFTWPGVSASSTSMNVSAIRN